MKLSLTADAGEMHIGDETFDVTLESTMFVQITDDDLSKRIALEMVRVTRSGGYILCRDWVVPKPGDRNYKALSRKRVAALFDVGLRSSLVSVFNGALVPPLGRFLSAHSPALYFPVQACLPFLVGQKTYVLRVADRNR